MHANIFSGPLSSVALAKDSHDKFDLVDNVVAFKNGLPAHEQAFDSLPSLRSELFNRPHLPNEEDTSIITAMVGDLNEGAMIVPLT